MNPPSRTHLVLIPSYDTGPRLAATVAEALRRWSPVWVVVDGSRDGSPDAVRALARNEPGLRVIERPRNGGKGAAVATGAETALAEGFTHVLTLDADGQHPADLIPAFMAASQSRPAALILGRPVFGPEAPAERMQGRKLSVALARLEILGPGIADPLFGFRVYPAAALLRTLRSTRWARRYDFDHEAAVRMVWNGTPTRNLPAPCRYLSRAEGGVSHFRYGRDNAFLVWLHVRLIAELLLWRWPRRRAWGGAAAALLLAISGLAGPAQAAPLADFAHDPGWTALLARLAPVREREAAFEERRFFPFRRAPLVLTGIARLAPGRGLSLEYLTPRRRIVIADDRGLLVRGESEGDRPAPADPRMQAAIGGLSAIFRLDPAELARRFSIAGERSAAGWSLSLIPRDAAGPFASLAVAGDASHVREIDLIVSPEQRIEIRLGPPQTGTAFTPAELARYFR
ncbi:MAG TPA: glycosyltransferase [Opitutaceae bacterium]|nr:glycosyltransferase [Opitutaceae bacterium]